MNKNTFFILFLLIPFLLVSCNKKGENSNYSCQTICLDQATQIDTIRFSSLFNDAKIITLDSCSQALIGDINRVEILDKYIFLLDRNIAKALFVFNEQGKFVRKIGNIGQGKGEYIAPFDFALDCHKKQIYVLDRQAKKIHTYNYMTGNHISSVGIPLFSTHILFYDDAIYTDYPRQSTKTKHLIRKANAKTGKELDLYLSPDIHNKGWNFTLSNNDGIFISRDSTPLFTHLFMDTVFQITSNGIHPYFAIKSDYMMGQKDIQNLNVDKNPLDLIELIKKDKYYNLQTYIETHNFIFFQLQKGVMPYPFTYDKKQKQTFKGNVLSEDIVCNNIDFKLTQLRFGGSNSSGAYFFLSPDGLTNFKQTNCKNINLIDEELFNGAIFYYEYKK